MNKTNFSATLDIHEIYSQFTMHIKKGDTTGRLTVTLMEGGKPYRIVDGCSAAFSAKKPDGNQLYNHCSIENNKIVYDLTLNTTAIAGKLECELLVFGEDSELLVSPRFTIIVDDTVYNGEQIESTEEFSALTHLVSEANSLIESVNEKLEKGEFNGDDYVLTDQDKEEIASKVDGYIADTLINANNYTDEKVNQAVTDINENVINPLNGRVNQQGTYISVLQDNQARLAAIAEGAQKAIVYPTYWDMAQDPDFWGVGFFRTGQNIYIKTLGVPDLWVYGTNEGGTQPSWTQDTIDDVLVEELKKNGVVQVGIYLLAPLETQKVDLTNYPTKDDLNQAKDEITEDVGFFLEEYI